MAFASANAYAQNLAPKIGVASAYRCPASFPAAGGGRKRHEIARVSFVRFGLGVGAVALLIAGFCVAVRAAAADATATASYAHVHHPVSSHDPAAQAAFDDGLTLLYAFSRTAARRAFHAAAAADPRFAMAYWGIAMSYGPNINLPPDRASDHAGYVAIQRALALRGTANASERDYIAAAATRFSAAAKPNFDTLGRNYNAAMRALARKYPDDPDAGTLFAESAMNLRPWDLYSPDGAPRPGTAAICSTLEAILKRWPAHIGANHLYIHATEASLHPELALQSAGLIGGLHFEPAASHLTHMPSHNWARTGFFQAAAAANVDATALDAAYQATAAGRKDEEQIDYYVHNLTFLEYAAGMDGDLPGARAAFARLTKVDAKIPIMFVLVRYRLWNEILALPRPAPNVYEPLRAVVWRFARAMAFAANGNLQGSVRERRLMDRAGATLHVPAYIGFNNSSAAILGLADDELDAAADELKHDDAGAIAALQSAVRTQDAFLYIEPPDWYAPSREALGGELLRAGRAREAAGVFRADLTHNPGNPRSLYGLAAADALLGDGRDARAERELFKKAWKSNGPSVSPQTL